MGYNPSYKWMNPTYPIYNWGYNPLTKWDEPPSMIHCKIWLAISIPFSEKSVGITIAAWAGKEETVESSNRREPIDKIIMILQKREKLMEFHGYRRYLQ